MYNGLVHAHSGLRWVVLILLLASVVNAATKRNPSSTYTAGDNKLYLFTLVSTHIQLVLGLILYFISPKVDFSLISEKLYRFYTVEHLTGMIIAIALITVGRARSRRAENAAAKHRSIFIFFGLGLLLILVSIPWPFRIPGAGWF